MAGGTLDVSGWEKSLQLWVFWCCRCSSCINWECSNGWSDIFWWIRLRTSCWPSSWRANPQIRWDQLGTIWCWGLSSNLASSLWTHILFTCRWSLLGCFIRIRSTPSFRFARSSIASRLRPAGCTTRTGRQSSGCSLSYKTAGHRTYSQIHHRITKKWWKRWDSWRGQWFKPWVFVWQGKAVSLLWNEGWYLHSGKCWKSSIC